MPKDHFDVVTALDSARDEAVKKRAGVPVAEKTATEKKSAKASAMEDLESQMSSLHAKGRELMKAGKQNTPEYDELVKQNKHLRRKRDFMADHDED